MLAKKVALLALGAAAGIFLAELSVRITRPDLGTLVRTHYIGNRFRIHANPKSSGYQRQHPDTGQTHLVFYNSLGLRQHREFTSRKPPGVVRVGLFGDSFAENNRLPVQYSLSEVLDFLLNRTGRFEVVNFGTDNYGTDQIYLQFLDEGVFLDLDLAVYMFFSNDLEDILKNRLVELGADGGIQYSFARPQSPAKRVLRNFYLTYFLLERVPSLESAMGEVDYDPRRLIELIAARGRNQGMVTRQMPLDHRGARKIFSALVEEMRKTAALAGIRFFVVLVPNKGTDHGDDEVKAILKELNIEYLDLGKVFEQQGQDRPKFFFQKDGHWNEAGNALAAVSLLEFLGPRLGIPAIDEHSTQRDLSEYFGSFPNGTTPQAWRAASAPSTARQDEIRNSYLGAEP